MDILNLQWLGAKNVRHLQPDALATDAGMNDLPQRLIRESLP